MMSIGQVYESRKSFVEEDILKLMAVKRDFSYIKYARDLPTEGEYMRIGDIQGRAVTLDITARSLEDIFEDISRINLMQKENISPPDNVITDEVKLRSVSALFV